MSKPRFIKPGLIGKSLLGMPPFGDAAASPSGFNWYVDSVSGNDANTGKSAAQAFATIAKLATVWAAGESVGLAKGSTWKESMVVPGVGCSISGYGAGNRPILDGSDIVAAGDWSKTVGQTNVYEATVTPDWGIDDWLNVYEDATHMTRVASVALCDSTQNSYYPSAATGTITLYIHTSDSTSPIVNGKTYEFTKRSNPLSSAFNNITVTSIETRRNLNGSGSLVVLKNSIVADCICRDGNKHNIEFGGGCKIDNVQAIDAYYGTTAGVMFIGYQSLGAGENVTVTNCSATNAVYDSYVSGFGFHTGGANNWGAITMQSCTGTNLGYFISNTSNLVAFTATGCSSTGCAFGITVNQASATYTITNYDHTSNLANGGVLLAATNTTLNVSGGTWTINDGGSTVTGAISVGTSNLVLSVTGVTARFNNSTGNRRFIDARSTGCSITANNNDIGGTTTAIWVYYFTVNVPFTSDFNSFAVETLQFYINATSYLNVTDYRAATSQDANSTVG